MAAERATGLQIIFSFFLGLMVAAFVGVGVYTFYPQPELKYQQKLQELYRQQEDIQNFKDPTKITPAERTRLRVIQKEIRGLEDKQTKSRETWGRVTSIILITFATAVMSISLIRADQLPVISNGLMLGGVFTMVYGVGWIVATGTSYARFAVMTVALVITLGLGYLRFVRGKRAVAAAVASGEGAAASDIEVAGLEARVANIERRLSGIADALQSKGD